MKSARQPRSTQMPRPSKPHVRPWTQGEPLRCCTIRTPPRVSAGQYFRPPSFEEHVIIWPLGGGGGPGLYPTGRTTKSARQPRSTQCAVVPLCAHKRELEQLSSTRIIATKKILDLVIVAFHGCVVCCVGQHIVLFHSRQAPIRARISRLCRLSMSHSVRSS